MTLRTKPRVTKWSPTADDPLNGCGNKVRWLYDLVKANPGIGESVAAARMGLKNAQASVATLSGRNLIEIRQDERFQNFLWPVSR